jgi:hypothetical protein
MLCGTALYWASLSSELGFVNTSECDRRKPLNKKRIW